MKVNSTITLNNKEFISATKNFKENDTVVMLVTRKKQSLLLKGKAVGLAYETSEKYDIV